MANSLTDIIEQQELIQKLVDAGLGDFVDTLLTHENKCYTKKSRLNKSGACRALGCRPKELDDKLEQCRQILGKDLF